MHLSAEDCGPGSKGSIGQGRVNRVITERPLQASLKGGLVDLGGQKVNMYKMPTIPANLLQKELWSSPWPDVCHWLIRHMSNVGPSIIQATAPIASLYNPSLTAYPLPHNRASCNVLCVPTSFRFRPHWMENSIDNIVWQKSWLQSSCSQMS